MQVGTYYIGTLLYFLNRHTYTLDRGTARKNVAIGDFLIIQTSEKLVSATERKKHRCQTIKTSQIKKPY